MFKDRKPTIHDTGRRRFTPARVLGMLILIVSLALLGYIPFTWITGKLHQRNLRSEFEEQVSCNVALNESVQEGVLGSTDPANLRQMATAYRIGMAKHQPIAKLEIPKMGKNLIVVEGDDDEARRMGTFHMPSTQLPGEGGNFVVGGDRVLSAAPFLYLDDLENGDQIYLCMEYGIFGYTIIEKRIVDPEDLSLIQPQVDANNVHYESIALFTCDPPWDTTNRLLVLGRMTGAAVTEEPPTAAAPTG